MAHTRPIAVIILAAGKGTRMKSVFSKVSHRICGKPMIQCSLDSFAPVKPNKTFIIVSDKNEMRAMIGQHKAELIAQKHKLGTGHAVMQATPRLKNFDGDVIVATGDSPLFTSDTIKQMIATHRKSFAVATLVYAKLSNPHGYGRIIRAGEQVLDIIEEKDASAEVRAIQDVNSGLYIFRAKEMLSALAKIKPSPVTGELYLTDIFKILNREGAHIVAQRLHDADEMLGVNNRVQLAKANKIMQLRIQEQLMEKGVSIVDQDNTYVEYDVKVGQDTIIYPFSLIYGNTKIGKHAVIGPFAVLKDAEIGDNVIVEQSNISESKIKRGAKVGPYAHIRNNTIVEEHAGIGNFVEATRTRFGKGVRAYHLSYFGDTTVGSDVNFGAGVITENYDGKNKNKTNIGADSYVSSGTIIVAPRAIPPKTRIAPGSTLTPKRKK